MPRRPAFYADLAGAQAGARRGPEEPRAQSENLQQLRAAADKTPGVQPNIVSIWKSLQDNYFMYEFRTGDISAEPWRRGFQFDRLIRDALNFLYF